MSLRFRLNLLITVLFILILAGGSYYVINEARVAVYDEVNSTARLTLQLIEIGLINASTQNQLEEQNKILEQLTRMEGTRHLQIYYSRSANADRNMPAGSVQQISADAPDWFVNLVKPPPIEFRRVIAGGNIPYMEILVRANPSDEITELWRETKGVLVLLLTFAVFVNIMVYISLGRGLAPIEIILNGLAGIEKGDYQLRLPEFNSPELSRISDKFNHMAEVLQKSREENKILIQRSLAIQENERRLLAQELHDELGQTITAIKAIAATIEKQAGPVSEQISNQARTIIETSEHMYQVAKGMTHRLRPAILDELGLVKALQDMIDEWNTRQHDCFCSFNFRGKFDRLSDEASINLYRIVQEGLTNIAKHSNATEVSVEMYDTEENHSDQPVPVNSIILTISDNGSGFDITGTSAGLGLIGMQERVEAINGRFNIDSRPGEGTVVRIIIPGDFEKNSNG